MLTTGDLIPRLFAAALCTDIVVTGNCPSLIPAEGQGFTPLGCSVAQGGLTQYNIVTEFPLLK